MSAAPDDWPATPEALVALQEAIGRREPDVWEPPSGRATRLGGCFGCFARGVTGPGREGDALWTAAVTVVGGQVVSATVRPARATGPYVPGQLAGRVGPPLADAVRRLSVRPDVLLVDATGRDHPRAAGLAVHLGAVLDLPTVGVTHRLLVGTGVWPPDAPGATSPIEYEGGEVGRWVRTKVGVRPLAVHAGWRTTPDLAVAVVLASVRGHRTPVPLREARRRARLARAGKCPGDRARLR